MPAQPSKLAIELAEIAWCDLNRTDRSEIEALAKAFDEKLRARRVVIRTTESEDNGCTSRCTERTRVVYEK